MAEMLAQGSGLSSRAGYQLRAMEVLDHESSTEAGSVPMTEQQRLALFLPSLRGGGAERVILALARSLSLEGIKVDLVVQEAEGAYVAQVDGRVRIVDLGACRMVRALIPLVSYLRREKPSAMLSAMMHTNIIAVLAARISKMKTRVVISQHTHTSMSSRHARTLRARYLKYLAKGVYRMADAIIAVSSGVAEDLSEILAMPSGRIRVIHNPAVTPQLFDKAEETLSHPWFAPGSPPVVLSAGRLTSAKAYPDLIRAVALVRESLAARLMILGEGDERSNLEALVRELGLEDSVCLPGFTDNPYKYMKHAALFVLSSRWEGFGMVLAEAMATGTPVVSTNCPSGPAEILQNGKWGKLVPVGDVDAIAKAIMEALDGIGIPDREQMSAYVRREFGLEAIAEKYADVLLGKG